MNEPPDFGRDKSCINRYHLLVRLIDLKGTICCEAQA